MHLAPHHRAYFILFIAANCITYFRVYPHLNMVNGEPAQQQR
jgi:hypothetical protein